MASRKQHKLLDAGSRAPDFQLERLNGGQVALQEIIAKGPVLLAFFKVTCPTCQFAFPFVERIHSAGALPIYGISQNGPEDTREFNQEYGVTFPTLLDTEESGYAVSNAFGISSVPTLFLIEPTGIITRVIEGWNKKEMAWLGGQAGTNPFRQGDNVPEWKAG
jgi:peroxiredoxin